MGTREGALKRWANPEFRERMKKKFKEDGPRRSEAAKKMWASRTDEERARITSVWNAGSHTIDAETKRSASLKGKTASTEARQNVSRGMKRYWESVDEDYRMSYMAPATAASLRAEPKRSQVEHSIHKSLERLGIDFELGVKVSWFYPDFVLPSHNIVIEGNGCYWHACQACGYDDEVKQRKDAERQRRIENKGYRLYVIWEHDTRRLTDTELDELILTLVTS